MSNHWRRLPTWTELAHQSGGGPLDPGDGQLRQFGRHLGAVTKRDNIVIVVVEVCGIPIGAPEFIGEC